MWCAAGSGVLARGLAQAWPNANRHVVQVGRTLSPNDVAGATIYKYPKPFEWAIKKLPPFPSDPHYDAKAWEYCLEHRLRHGGADVALFWNVTGRHSLNTELAENEAMRRSDKCRDQIISADVYRSKA